MLELQNISKSYTTGEFTQIALDKVSLKFRKSEFVAILGHSGSGKTTCLNVIGGLDRYDSGDLIINGRSTKLFRASEWDAYRNNSIGFVFQNYNLIPHLNVRDNVEMGMTLSGMQAAKRRAKALEVLDKVGLREHAHKRPNQLSGGQMQRVAIARALANDPDIILADEPTGALDTTTSVQIMDLIREIAADKLVIMVTHNPEIAHRYANRIVEFRDGQVISDSNPYSDEDSASDYSLKKTSMSFFTALKTSLKNISTKKMRTALTAFASSIGIIGIALVLSLSNGFDQQITDFENTTLSGFPIMITQTSTNIDVSAMQEQMRTNTSQFTGISDRPEQYPDAQEVYPYDQMANSFLHTNIFTDEYIDYLNNIDPALISGLSYTRLVSMNLLVQKDDSVRTVDTSSANFTAYPINLSEDDPGYLETSYDLLAGEFPSEKEDLVLIVSSRNRLNTSVLTALGLDPEAEAIPFDEIVGKEYKLVLNDDFYSRMGEFFIADLSPEALREKYDNGSAITLTIAGIIRAKEDIQLEVLSAGIAYSDDLSQFLIDNAQDSEVVKAQREADYNVFTGQSFDPAAGSAPSGGMGGMMSGMMGGSGSGDALTKDTLLSSLGADGIPYMITLYPRDFGAKDDVNEYLNRWNDDKEVEDSIFYTDLAETFTTLSGGIMDGITIVLIAFASISLVVSLIMIGIITYISVLERTKEIGVLRALGARKRDISRVFNAETFLIGVGSGLLGIAIAYLLTIPVNLILYNLTELKNVAQLHPAHATFLIVISVLLTLLGGLIPARMASNKDPVEALRTE